MEKLLHWLGRSMVSIGAGLLFEMDTVRHSPLPKGPKIIAPNHPTTTDPFLILTLASEQISILIDERLFKVPVFGAYLHGMGHIPVVPGNGRAAFDEGQRRLRAGQSIAIFPEGAISPLEGGFHGPRTGAARLALMTGAPVIPVGIHLDRKRIRLVTTMIEDEPAVGTWYLGGPFAMTVGEPMIFQGDAADRALVHAASEQIMQRVIRLAQESAYRMARAQAPAAIPAADTGEFAIVGGGG
jgi:1-acyl-sn-glycerol-3-phosphate acyltransferase